MNVPLIKEPLAGWPKFRGKDKECMGKQGTRNKEQGTRNKEWKKK
jgi:hypothetical protein